MNNSSSNARYFGIGAVIYSVVSLIWLNIPFAFGTIDNEIIRIAGILAIIGLVVVAVRLILQSPTPKNDEDTSKTGMWFGIIFTWEGIGIGVVSGILIALEQTDWIPVAVVIIVGLHFFPLARVLKTPIDYSIGIVLLLVGILTPILIAEPTDWISVISICTAIVLYIAGWTRIFNGQALAKSDAS